jgi:hypothetical protein
MNKTHGSSFWYQIQLIKSWTYTEAISTLKLIDLESRVAKELKEWCLYIINLKFNVRTYPPHIGKGRKIKFLRYTNRLNEIISIIPVIKPENVSCNFEKTPEFIEANNKLELIQLAKNKKEFLQNKEKEFEDIVNINLETDYETDQSGIACFKHNLNGVEETFVKNYPTERTYKGFLYHVGPSVKCKFHAKSQKRNEMVEEYIEATPVEKIPGLFEKLEPLRELREMFDYFERPIEFDVGEPICIPPWNVTTIIFMILDTTAECTREGYRPSYHIFPLKHTIDFHHEVTEVINDRLLDDYVKPLKKKKFKKQIREPTTEAAEILADCKAQKAILDKIIDEEPKWNTVIRGIKRTELMKEAGIVTVNKFDVLKQSEKCYHQIKKVSSVQEIYTVRAPTCKLPKSIKERNRQKNQVNQNRIYKSELNKKSKEDLINFRPTTKQLDLLQATKDSFFTNSNNTRMCKLDSKTMIKCYTCPYLTRKDISLPKHKRISIVNKIKKIWGYVKQSRALSIVPNLVKIN